MSFIATYNRFPIEFVRGEGPFLYDSEGNQYIDFVSGIAVTNLGHAHPDVNAALCDQANKLWHVSNLYNSDVGNRAVESLRKASGYDNFFMCNSGAEANEALFKLARKHGAERLDGAYHIVTLKQSFHGRTFAAMNLTAQSKIHQGFGPMPDGFVYIDANDIQGLTKAFEEHKVCAVLVEPILAEGGGIKLEESFVQKIAELCAAHRALFMVDEVQTGAGRTGQFLAQHHWNVRVDATSMAKGLGNGFPIAAIGVRKEHTEVLGPGSHGSTFGGGMLAMSVLEAVLGELRKPSLLENVLRAHQILEDWSQRIKSECKIQGYVGQGLWWIINPKKDALKMEQEARDAGVLVLPTQGTLIRILPPLNIDEEVLVSGLNTIETLLSAE